MESESVYRYKSLSSGSIRLLIVLAGDPSSALHCSLITISFSRSPLPINNLPQTPYEALSYTWGDGKKSRHIICDNVRINITQNLFEALHQLRHQDRDRSLWVDALCIDQSHYEEKASQIPLMRYIYGRATCVLIWLGPADEFTEDALSMINRAAELLRTETGKYIVLPHGSEVKRESQNTHNIQTDFPRPEGVDEAQQWKPLLKLWSRPWFKRTWIIQESAMAASAVVVIGEHQRDWADFGVAATCLAFRSYSGSILGLTTVAETVLRLWQVSRLALTKAKMTPRPLIFLLEFAASTKATDPRDKVYSLLGLAQEEPLVRVDYTRTVKDLFTDVARYMLCHPSHVATQLYLRLLANVKYHEAEDKQMGEEMDEDERRGWPSWVPRWQNPPPSQQTVMENRKNGLYIMSNLASSVKFHAGGYEYRGAIANPFDPYSILIEGFVFTTISTSVNFLKTPPLDRPRLWSLITDIRSVREDRHALYPPGEIIDEAFAQTLTLSTPVNGIGPDTYHAIDFTHFCLAIFDQTGKIMESQEQSDEYEAMKTEFQAEYTELKNIVGEHEKSTAFSPELQNTCIGRKLFGTKDGYIGLGDDTLKADDLVCVLFGGKMPFILRRMEGYYKFIGECYLHGIMESEAVEEGRKNSQWFELR